MGWLRVTAFVEANKFDGARLGMVFKSGHQGTGYYWDAPEANIAMWEVAQLAQYEQERSTSLEYLAPLVSDTAVRLGWDKRLLLLDDLLVVNSSNHCAGKS